MVAHTADLERKIVAMLEELGGQAWRDESVLHEGNKIILPVGMSLRQGAEFLLRKEQEEIEPAEHKRIYRYRPNDVAHATYKALKDAFGAVGHRSQTIQTFFGPSKAPPALIDVPIGPGEITQVPWGDFTVPFLSGVEFQLGTTRDEELGTLGQIIAIGPKGKRFAIEGVFKLVENELRERSIYKGKAINGKEIPEFLDLSKVDRNKVVYSEDVFAQLEASVWGPITYSDSMREAGLSLKRAALMFGPYGTGKTLAAYLTAQLANEHGWTFLYARPGRDDLEEVMMTAQLYAPAVVFFEDIDVIATPEVGQDGISQMLDMLDGISAKGREIQVIFTTNHEEKIHKGMVRPGRLDAIIEIGAPDAHGIRRLIEVAVGEDKLADKLDWKVITDACAGFLPAFVAEAATRALRYAITRNKGVLEGIRLDTEDFVNSANGLRPQLDLMEGAREQADRHPLDANLRQIVADEVERVMHPDLLVEVK